MAISDDEKYSLTGAEIKTLASKINEKAPASNVYTKTEIDSKLTSAMTYKGTVATVADLPSTDNKVGDVYNVTATGDNYAWDGSNWDKLSGVVDLSNYYTKSETDTELDTKVDKVSGKGLSTEDFTTAEKTKLNGIESGAEANVIESVSVNGTQQTITNKNVDLVIENAISGNTAPTTTTEGTLGQTYVDTSTGDLYYLSAIDETTSPTTYIWEKIAIGEEDEVVTLYAQQPDPVDLDELETFIAGLENEKVGFLYTEDKWHKVDSYSVSSTTLSGSFVDTYFDIDKFRVRNFNFNIDRQTGVVGGSVNYSTVIPTSIPTVVQTTGVSTTQVMSQNATTSMVFADPATRERVKIGGGASTGSLSVAIGYASIATSEMAISLGANSAATKIASVAFPGSATGNKGEVAFGLTDEQGISTKGYNDSKYRLLTGLYDPQSEHDAATKGYVDNALSSVLINGGTTVPTSSTVGQVGTQYNCVNNGEPEIYICTAVDTSTTPATYTWNKVG